MQTVIAKYTIIWNRDKRYDGTFYFAVKTTGIVCRPSCPANRPLPKNLEFYDLLETALASGFRPCKRCKPEELTQNEIYSSLHLLDEMSIQSTAQTIGMSERHLRRLTHDNMGVSPHALMQAKRIMEAKRLLSQTSLDIVDVAFSSGFNSLRQFNDVFKQETGETPRAYRKAHTVSEAAHTGLVDITIRIPFKKPLAWLPLKNALLAHMIPGLEIINVTNQTLTRLLKINGRQVKLVLDLSEPDDAIRATLSITSMEDVSEAVQTIKRVLDTGSDPAHITAVFQDDSLIGPLNKRLPGLRVCGMFDPFELLINTIIGQQVSISAARTFSERLVKAYGEQRDGLYLFPTAKTLLSADAFEMYQKTKINHKKVATIQAVCQLIAEGFDLKSITKSETARQKLLAVKGIGPWTVEYVILRGFGDADGFPADDLFIKRLLEVKTAKAAEAKAEKWRPYRGYATMYLWTKGTYE